MAEISTAPAISTDVHVSNDTKRSDAEVQQLRESLARAQSELTRVTAELATVTAERDRLRTDLEQMNDEVEKLKKAAETTKAENEQVLTKLQQQLKTAEEKELRTAAQVSFKDNRLKRLEKELNEAKSKIGGVATPTTPAIPTGVPNKPVPTPATTAATASTKPSLSIRGSGVPPGASTEASSSSATVAPTPTATRGRGAPRARGVARGRGAARGRGGRPVNNMDILECEFEQAAGLPTNSDNSISSQLLIREVPQVRRRLRLLLVLLEVRVRLVGSSELQTMLERRITSGRGPVGLQGVPAIQLVVAVARPVDEHAMDLGEHYRTALSTM